MAIEDKHANIQVGVSRLVIVGDVRVIGEHLALHVADDVLGRPDSKPKSAVDYGLLAGHDHEAHLSHQASQKFLDKFCQIGGMNFYSVTTHINPFIFD